MFAPNIATTDSLQVFERALRKAVAVMAPPPRLTVSQWADAKRKLSSESSPEPGQWRTSYNPLHREILDEFSNPLTETVVVMSSGQFGKTEDILNVAGYHMEFDPCPMLIIRPTEDEAKSFVKDRLQPMVRDTPSLQSLILETRTKGSDNTLFHKKFPGGHVTTVWAGSPAGVASRPIRIMLADEIDLYPVDAVSKGRKRTARFWNRRIGLFSTPTYEGLSTIESEFNSSDKRYPHVPCLFCGTFQKLVWEQIEWQQGRTDTAIYVCGKCSRAWTDRQRGQALKEAVWRPEKDFRGKAGFAAWEIHVPSASLGKMAEEFINATEKARYGDNEPLQNWTNLTYGKSWALRGKTVEPDPLYARRENYTANALPYRILYLTAGVDVQDNRLELEIIGWRREKRNDVEESWGVEYIALYGDPAQKQIWDDLDECLKREWITEDGRRLRLGAVCIDSGGHHAEQVYRFCNSKIGRHIYSVKGQGGSRPIWPRLAGKSKKYKGSLVWGVGVDTTKARIYGHLRVNEAGQGYCHFPLSYDEAYFRGLTAEQLMTRHFHGQPVLYFFLPAGKRNEPLDVRCYAMAALFSRPVSWEVLARNAPSEPPPEQPGDPSTPPASQASPAGAKKTAARGRSIRFRVGGR